MKTKPLALADLVRLITEATGTLCRRGSYASLEHMLLVPQMLLVLRGENVSLKSAELASDNGWTIYDREALAGGGKSIGVRVDLLFMQQPDDPYYNPLMVLHDHDGKIRLRACAATVA